MKHEITMAHAMLLKQQRSDTELPQAILNILEQLSIY
jgi:hypothetical protein